MFDDIVTDARWDYGHAEALARRTNRGRWSEPGVPHKGWECTDVYDDKPADAGRDWEPTHVCEMCKATLCRFIHVMEHPEFPEVLEVGHICAAHMERPYDVEDVDISAFNARVKKLKAEKTRQRREEKKAERKRAEQVLIDRILKADGPHLALLEREASNQRTRKALKERREWLEYVATLERAAEAERQARAERARRQLKAEQIIEAFNADKPRNGVQGVRVAPQRWLCMRWFKPNDGPEWFWVAEAKHITDNFRDFTKWSRTYTDGEECYKLLCQAIEANPDNPFHEVRRSMCKRDGSI